MIIGHVKKVQEWISEKRMRRKSNNKEISNYKLNQNIIFGHYFRCFFMKFWIYLNINLNY